MLNKALSVFSNNKFNFADHIKTVTTHKNNLLGDVAFERAVKLVVEKNYTAAQSEINNALKFFKSTKNLKNYRKINRYWLCAQGDKLLTQYNSMLENDWKKGDYDKALTIGNKVLELYKESGDEKRVELIGDPEITVKHSARDNAEKLKAEALALLDECEMNKAREKALSAKTCLEWSGDTTGSISDILAVVKLAEHRMKGDDRLNEAENIYRCVMGVIWGYYL